MTLSDMKALMRIGERAHLISREALAEVPASTVIAVVGTVHKTVCPIRLQELLDATDVDFTHDVFGIIRHYDLHTNTLTDCFVPRFAHGQL